MSRVTDAMVADGVADAARKAVGALAICRSTPTEGTIEAWKKAMRDFALTCARSVAGQLSDEAKVAMSQLIAAGLLHEKSGGEPMSFVQFTSSVLDIAPEKAAASAEALRELVGALASLSLLSDGDTPCQH